MKFFIKHCNLKSDSTDCIVVGIFKSNILTTCSEKLNYISNDYILNILKNKDFIGRIGDTLLLYNVPNVIYKRILLVGCGKKSGVNLINYKKILQSYINIIKKTTISNIIDCLATDLVVKKQDIYWKLRVYIELVTNNNYAFNIFKLSKKSDLHLIQQITFHTSNEYEKKIGKISIKHAKAIALGISAAKNLSNMPPNICTPLYLSDKVHELSKKYHKNISYETFNFKQIKKIGMLAYSSVGQGSINKPWMSIIHYQSDPCNNSQPIILIGKGVTFDSGGISIKPSQNMHEMKFDMSGAAVVYGTILAISELQLPLKIIGILAGCENMPGGSSFKPGDILQTLSGKTVEILDTDAEGRLILCDILTYVEKFSPELVIDIATLTGACVVALGDVASGLISNDDKLTSDLIESGQLTDDKIWNLPMYPEYMERLKSNIADIRNIGEGGAGAITAACFLSFFVKNYKWAHVDIAGTSWVSGKNSRSTGRPVALLSQFLLKKAFTNVYF